VSDSASTSVAAIKSKVSGWIKALVGAVAGVVSGAVMMYVSPLVQKVIEPAKPVANFGFAPPQGTTVVFHNRSTGASQGWWDFGDGSSLEPMVPNQEFMAHTYPHAGDFTAKLTVRNGIGQENERSLSVRLTSGSRPPAGPPKIESLDAIPISPTSYAPATFRLVTKVRNAQVCVWDVGDERPLDVITENANEPDKLVTFKKPGGYVIKLVAVNGTQHAQKSEIVNVLEPPTGTLTAYLTVTDQGQKIQAATTTYTFSESFPATSSDDVYRLSRQVRARPGFQIAEVRFPLAGDRAVRLPDKGDVPLEPGAFSGQGARDLRLHLADQRQTLKLTGELIKEAGRGTRSATLPSVVVPVTYVEEQRTPATRQSAVTATLNAPGSTTLLLPPLPADWDQTRRQYRLELRDGDKVVWQEQELPRGAGFTFRNRRYTLTAVAEREQAHLVLAEVLTGVTASSR
jgi:PKD repeat protein